VVCPQYPRILECSESGYIPAEPGDFPFWLIRDLGDRR
jgi:hypothetical protein